MTVALLFAAYFFTDGLSNYIGKRNSMLASNFFQYGIFLTLNGFFAMINFAVMSGFNIQFSRINLIYGIIYGLCCCFSVVADIVTLHYTTVAFKMIFVGAVSLAINQFIGVIIFSEEILAENIIKCLIRIVAAIITVSPREYGGKTAHKGVFWCVICVLISSVCTIVTKSGAMQKELDPNSWFFLTNLFMFIVSSIFTAVTVKLFGFKFKDEFKSFGKKGTFFVFLSSVTSNVWSLIGVYLMELIDLSYFSPVSSALSMIACFVVSRFVLREPAGKRIYLAVILSIIAVII